MRERAARSPPQPAEPTVPNSSSGPSRPLDATLFARRCAIYSEAAAVILDLEDALDQQADARVEELLDSLRRCLRGSLISALQPHCSSD